MLASVPESLHTRLRSHPCPTGTARATATTSLAISWKPVASAANDRFSDATDSKFKKAKIKTGSAASLELSGLKPKTTYWVRVRALDAKGRNLTGYSKAVKLKTRSKGSYSLLSPAGLTAGAATGGNAMGGGRP